MSLRAIQYERRLKYKSAFILQKIDPYEMVLVNSLRKLSVSVRRLFTRTISWGSIFCKMNADLYFNLLSYWIARRLINMTVLFEFLMKGCFPWSHGLGSRFLSQTPVLFLFFHESPWDLPQKSDLSTADVGQKFALKVNPRSFSFHGDYYSNSLCQIELNSKK